MAESRHTGFRRDILFERGLAEWLSWVGSAVRTESLDGRSFPERSGTLETSNEIVTLLANIIRGVM